MVILFSYVNPILVLFATAVLAVHGYRHNSIDEETTLPRYRFGEDTTLNHKRETGKNLMWIGPRLGRRKRSEEENNSINLPEKNGAAVLEFLQDSPWAFVALKGGLNPAGSKCRTVNFIPRLGRDSEEEYADGGADIVYAKSTSRSGTQMTGPFAVGNNFTPRLGRFAALFNKDHL